MDRVIYKLVLPVIVVLALTACGSSIGGGRVDGSTIAGDPPTTGFSVELKDTSFFAGGSLDGLTVTSNTDSGKLIAEVYLDNAADLKGVFFDLHYDATTMNPVVANPTELLAETDSLLHLAILSDPGVVHFGEAVLKPDTVAGYSGNGVVATVEFAKGAAKSNRVKEKAASQTPQINLGWWMADTLFWKYDNPGDYDLNGEVNVADIVPIVLHYGEYADPSYPTHIRVIDGDGNREINLADITTIVLNFGNSFSGGYDLFSSANVNDLPENNGGANGPGALFENNIPFSLMFPEDSDVIGAAHQFDFLETLSAISNDRFYWIMPIDQLGQYGVPSTSITLHSLFPRTGTPMVWTDDNALSVIWSYDNEGDFNQDGLTSMGDIEVVIQGFGQSGPFDYLSVQSMVDFNQDNEINLSDITGIVRNFLSFISGYNLYASSSITDYVEFGESTITPFHSVSMAEAIGDPSIDRLTFSYGFEGEIPAYVWVRSFGPDGTEGDSSNLVDVSI